MSNPKSDPVSRPRVLKCVAWAAGLPVSYSRAAATSAAGTIRIDNFAFGPAVFTVAPGTNVTFAQVAECPYFRSLHPQMTGKVVVRRE